MGADAKTEVTEVFETWMKAYEDRDVEKVLACYTPDAVYIGTGEDEKMLGVDEMREGFERAFAQCDSMDVEIGWTSVSSHGEVAWLVAECLFRIDTGGPELWLHGRVTAVLVKRDGRWLVAHSHTSTPHTGSGGQSFPRR